MQRRLTRIAYVSVVLRSINEDMVFTCISSNENKLFLEGWENHAWKVIDVNRSDRYARRKKESLHELDRRRYLCAVYRRSVATDDASILILSDRRYLISHLFFFST